MLVQPAAAIRSSFSTSALKSMLIGAGVFSLCLAGIASRPHFDLATFWPANAFLLGILVRFPSLANLNSWACAAIGFLLADALTGSDWQTNISLNVCNLAAIATGHHILSALPPTDRALQRPRSMLHLLRAVLAAATVAAIVGMIANPILFGGSWHEGFAFWFVTEIMNYSAFLPVLLTLPALGPNTLQEIRKALLGVTFSQLKPLFALVVSCGAAAVIDGPGAIAFPIPALLWCALSYSLFTTALLALVSGLWTIVAIRTGILWVGPDFDSRSFLVSVRLGVTLMALAPLVVGSVMAARKDLLNQMRLLAETDAMTGLRNRRSFLEEGKAVLQDTSKGRQPVTVMMLDIDHFKSINDTHGHDAGDAVLIEFACLLKRNVRPQDEVGRMGGEEFAIILPGSGRETAATVADRINAMVRAARISLPSGEEVSITVSTGIHVDETGASLESLLTHADKALYQAKKSGRNRAVFSPGNKGAVPLSA